MSKNENPFRIFSEEKGKKKVVQKWDCRGTKEIGINNVCRSEGSFFLCRSLLQSSEINGDGKPTALLAFYPRTCKK